MARFKALFGLVKLPTPNELGWSDRHNALGMRSLTPFQEGKTWEDWDAYCAKNHPVKYFIVERIPKFFLPAKNLYHSHDAEGQHNSTDK